MSSRRHLISVINVVFLLLMTLLRPYNSFLSTPIHPKRNCHVPFSTMAPADLTPAIDKFVRLPTGPNVDPYFMTAKGPVPTGPEPFDMVSKELQPLSDYVKEMVTSENPVLTMAASHFFEKVNRYKHTT
jgi:hypothetical protein